MNQINETDLLMERNKIEQPEIQVKHHKERMPITPPAGGISPEELKTKYHGSMEELKRARDNQPAAAGKNFNLDIKPEEPKKFLEISEDAVKKLNMKIEPDEPKAENKDSDELNKKTETQANPTQQPSPEIINLDDDEPSEPENNIPFYKDLRFKSPGNDGIVLTVYLLNFATKFDFQITYNGVLKPEKIPLSNKWYSKKGDIKSICDYIFSSLKKSKPGIHKDGLKAELTEWASKEIEPLIKKPPTDKNRFYTKKDGSIIRHSLNFKTGEYIDNMLTNFVFDIETRIINIDTKDVEYQGSIKCGVEPSCEIMPFSIDSDTLSDRRLFIKALNKSGLKVVFNHDDIPDIIQAFQHFVSENDEVKTIRKTSKIGWYEYDDDRNGSIEYFLTKSVKIDWYGIQKNEDIVIEMPENSGSAKFIDLDIISDEDFQKCGRHIMYELIKLHDPYFMRVALSKTFGSPYLKEIARHSDEAKYITEYIGRPQSGKSLVKRLMQCFFGHFPFVDDGFVTFGSTIYSIQDVGKHFKDILFLADDLKQKQLSDQSVMKQISTMIHNYVSGVGRKRLGDAQSSPPIEGSLVITSEGKTSIDEGDASRTLSVIVPSIKKNFELRDKCIKMRELYPGFMARYIEWNIRNTNLINSEKLLPQYQKMFFENFKEIPNVDPTRFSNMYAITLIEYQRFLTFMVSSKFITSEIYEKELKDFTDLLIKNGKDSVSMLADNEPATKFISVLDSVISSGGAIIIDKKETLPEDRNKTVIGKITGNTICIIPDAAIEIVRNKLRSANNNLPLDKNSLSKNFNDKKMLIEKDTKGFLKSTWMVNKSIGCWSFDKTIFGYKNESTVDIKMSIPMSILSAINKSGINEKPSMSGSQYESIKMDVYEDLHFKESDIDKYADTIDIALTAFYLGKGWSKEITLL